MITSPPGDLRWPDGSYVAADPHAEAARLQADTRGWCVWFGQFTGHYWAMPLHGPLLSVEARTPGDLVAAMSWRARREATTN